MAQDTKPTVAETPEPDSTQIPPDEADGRFHYYSGGEVKELADTRVSPWLWGSWTVVIIAGLAYFFYGGALGPRFGGFKPVGGSQAGKEQVQTALNAQAGGLKAADTLDMTRLPLPPGQDLKQAIVAGSNVYQTNCIGCHGPNQDGNGVNAASLNPKPRNLRDAPFMQGMSYERITTSVHKGVPGTAMPRWENTLTDAEIKDVIAYVFSLTAPVPASTPKSASGSTTGNAGGSHTYRNGEQSSPKPITPPVNGNPAASTNTAPPSQSGPPAGTTRPSSPDAGGQSAAPAFQPSKPKAAAPVPGSSTPAVTKQEPGSGSAM